MKKYAVCILALSFALSGCVVRTYRMTKDRVDQDLSAGNRGYLQGSAPSVDESARKTTRTTRVIEVELSSPIKFEKSAKKKRAAEGASSAAAVVEDTGVSGNRGFITESITPEIVEPSFESYTVQKGDTLQKISKKFYGTTKKWHKLYKANEDVLKSPNNIRPGQVIKIPATPDLKKLQELKEPAENLK